MRLLRPCCAGALLLAFSAMPMPAPAADIGKDLEIGLGRMVARELESEYGVVDDPLLAGWVDRMGQKLASVSGRKDLTYRFKVLNSDDVNATAAPGGFVFVNRGTLRFVQSEDELAAVLGHEVGHVAGKHAVKQFNAQIIGALLMVGFQAAHADTLRTVGGLAGGLAMLKFSRDEENDADRRGLRNATASGYDGHAMLEFFRRLKSTEKDRPSKFEAYFLTHPPTDERIRRISEQPGSATTTENAAALGDGLASRCLYKEAAALYRVALGLDPTSPDLRKRIAEANLHVIRVTAASQMEEGARTSRLAQLSQLQSDIQAARAARAEDLSKLADSQKDMDHELEWAARALTDASHMIGPHDALQIRHFMRLARSFDQATQAGANIRSSRDMSVATLNDLEAVVSSAHQAVEKGDRDAGDQVDGLVMAGQGALRQLTSGLHQARGQAGDTTSGIRNLRFAAETLANSYRMPLGLSGGQADILNLQVASAIDPLGDSVPNTARAVTEIAKARLDTQLRRLNFAARSVPSDDPSANGIVAHYLGIDPALVAPARSGVGLGDAAYRLAEIETARLYAARKKKAAKDGEEVATPRPEPAVAKKKRDAPLMRPENATVLFGLMLHDIERETNNAPYDQAITRLGG